MTDADTVESIMALAFAWRWQHTDDKEAALRAAVERVIAEKERLDEGWAQANSDMLAERFKTIEQFDRAERAEQDAARLRKELEECRRNQ